MRPSQQWIASSSTSSHNSQSLPQHRQCHDVVDPDESLIGYPQLQELDMQWDADEDLVLTHPETCSSACPDVPKVAITTGSTLYALPSTLPPASRTTYSVSPMLLDHSRSRRHVSTFSVVQGDVNMFGCTVNSAGRDSHNTFNNAHVYSREFATGNELPILGSYFSAKELAIPALGVLPRIDSAVRNTVGRDINNIYHFTLSSNAIEQSNDFCSTKPIMNWLSKLNGPATQIDVFNRRTPGTGSKFLQGPAFQQWLKGETRTIWGVGMPGAGKTILTSVAIDHLQLLEKNHEDFCVAFLYGHEAHTATVEQMLGSFLKQLLAKHTKHVLTFVKPLYEQHSHHGTHPSHEELFKVLEQITRSKQFTKQFYVLEGLDGIQTPSAIVRNLLRLPVSLMIVSRCLDYINDIVPNAFCFRIAASDVDISKLVEEKIAHSPTLRQLLTQNRQWKHDVISSVCAKSQGMFLLAALLLQELGDCLTVAQLCKTLEALPKGVNEMYNKTWERINAQPQKHVDLVKLALTWVCYAADRYLHAEDLELAIAICPQTFQFQKAKLVGASVITSLCCGLLELDIESKSIQLIHYTLKEFLAPHLEPLEPYVLLASACATRLLECDIRNESPLGQLFELQELGELIPAPEEDSTSDRFLHYCHRNWALHARQCKKLPKAVIELVKQCRSYWQLGSPWEDGDATADMYHPSNVFHIAALYNYPELLGPLLSKGADVMSGAGALINEGEGCRDASPLMVAVANGHDRMVDVLLQWEGVDVNAKDNSGQTALILACRFKKEAAVRRLLADPRIDANAEYGGRQGKLVESALYVACASNDTTIVALLLKHRKLKITPGPLHTASKAGEVTIMKMLLQRGADVNASDKSWPTTPLMHASTPEAAALLLARPDTNINAVDNNGRTALMHSLIERRRGVFEMLLAAHSINVHHTNHDGITTLMLAAQTLDLRVLELVLNSSGFNVNAQDAFGRTALMHVFLKEVESESDRSRYRQVVECLLSIEGIDLSITDSKRMNVLMHSSVINISSPSFPSSSGQASCQPVPDIGSTSMEGQDPSTHPSISTVSEHKMIVDLLRRAGQFDINAVDAQGRAALAQACRTGALTGVEALLGEKGLDVNQADFDGWTPLMHASYGGNPDIVRRLLQFRWQTDVYARSSTGRTALDIADMTTGREWRKKDGQLVVQLLQKAMSPN
ncbi:ankyrin [Coprinopsis marcescibilis]|uniref:Ankyrin n=1 Tax=Coprinopsis marcescibilis TaxID=230819 RepID=A0A5C3L0Q6_COPMA|nr:ankyrin [Coprinopsis marcescibilis]